MLKLISDCMIIREKELKKKISIRLRVLHQHFLVSIYKVSYHSLWDPVVLLNASVILHMLSKNSY